jgi:hypothetical protein
MHDFEGDEFIIGRRASCNEEERCITAVNYLGVFRELSAGGF